MVRINGLFHLHIKGVYSWVITHLLAIDPNFRRDIQVLGSERRNGSLLFSGSMDMNAGLPHTSTIHGWYIFIGRVNYAAVVLWAFLGFIISTGSTPQKTNMSPEK